MEPNRLVVQQWSAFLVSNERCISLHEVKTQRTSSRAMVALASNKNKLQLGQGMKLQDDVMASN